MILTFKRAVMVNSINQLVNRPDLLDRSVVFNALPIPESYRKVERDFWEAFDNAKPGILSGLFDLLSHAMRVRPTMKISHLPRMADFAAWGAAIAVAMGWGQEAFLKAYQADALRRNEDAIEASLVAQCIIHFSPINGSWEGTASELLQGLKPVADSLRIDLSSRDWPKRANILSRRVNELIPVLRAAGIEVSHGYRAKEKVIKIKLMSARPTESSAEPTESTVSPENTAIHESTKTDDTGDSVSIFSTSAGEGDFEL